jgi:hypothetical protein
MRATIKNSHTKYQSGATLAEALYILPIFFIIIFGMVEMTFIYKAKNTLNLASAEAVRKGTLNNADLDSIKTAFAEGMAPLYASKKKCPGVGQGTIIAAGYNCARLIQTFMDTGNNQKALTVISPSKEIYDAFKVELKVNVVGSTQEKNYVIPNDNLKWRDPTEKNVSIGGVNRNIGIQDANLLKIKTYWCQKLSVPGLDRLFYNSVLRFSGSQEQKQCNKLSQNNTSTSLTNTVFGKSRGYYIAIRSHAIARMQSPVFAGESGGNLLTDNEIDSIINPTVNPLPDSAIDESVVYDDPYTITPSGPSTCDPTVSSCGTNGQDYCDANTGTCYDCSTSPIGLCVEVCDPSTGASCICEIDIPNITPIPTSTSSL